MSSPIMEELDLIKSTNSQARRDREGAKLRCLRSLREASRCSDKNNARLLADAALCALLLELDAIPQASGDLVRCADIVKHYQTLPRD